MQVLHNSTKDVCHFELETFLTIKNHGIPENLINSMLSTARELFKLPESERQKNYSSVPSKETRLSTSFNVSTEKPNEAKNLMKFLQYKKLQTCDGYDEIHSQTKPKLHEIFIQIWRLMNALDANGYEAFMTSFLASGVLFDIHFHGIMPHNLFIAGSYMKQPHCLKDLPGLGYNLMFASNRPQMSREDSEA